MVNNTNKVLYALTLSIAMACGRAGVSITRNIGKAENSILAQRHEFASQNDKPNDFFAGKFRDNAWSTALGASVISGISLKLMPRIKIFSPTGAMAFGLGSAVIAAGFEYLSAQEAKKPSTALTAPSPAPTARTALPAPTTAEEQKAEEQPTAQEEKAVEQPKAPITQNTNATTQEEKAEEQKAPQQPELTQEQKAATKIQAIVRDRQARHEAEVKKILENDLLARRELSNIQPKDILTLGRIYDELEKAITIEGKKYIPKDIMRIFFSEIIDGAFKGKDINCDDMLSGIFKSISDEIHDINTKIYDINHDAESHIYDPIEINIRGLCTIIPKCQEILDKSGVLNKCEQILTQEVCKKAHKIYKKVQLGIETPTLTTDNIKEKIRDIFKQSDDIPDALLKDIYKIIKSDIAMFVYYELNKLPQSLQSFIIEKLQNDNPSMDKADVADVYKTFSRAGYDHNAWIDHNTLLYNPAYKKYLKRQVAS